VSIRRVVHDTESRLDYRMLTGDVWVDRLRAATDAGDSEGQYENPLSCMLVMRGRFSGKIHDSFRSYIQP
jgi:hypothetical protein